MQIDEALVEEAILEVEHEEPAIARVVARIVRANVQQGRLRKFLLSGAVASEGEYVRLVATRYRQQREYVRLVKDVQDAGVWETLYVQLQKWAYGVLTKKQFGAPRTRFDHAVQCATDAALVILDRHFPFDADFHAWAYVIVYYVCRSHVRRERRGRSVPDEAQVSLDRWEGWLENLSDATASSAQRQAEMQHDLLQYVAALGESQREFVVLYYFEQKSYADVARLMGRDKNALYKLNFDALSNLRKKMLLNQHIYE